jgi:hypothetical protein
MARQQPTKFSPPRPTRLSSPSPARGRPLHPTRLCPLQSPKRALVATPFASVWPSGARSAMDSTPTGSVPSLRSTVCTASPDRSKIRPIRAGASRQIYRANRVAWLFAEVSVCGYDFQTNTEPHLQAMREIQMENARLTAKRSRLFTCTWPNSATAKLMEGIAAPVPTKFD